MHMDQQLKPIHSSQTSINSILFMVRRVVLQINMIITLKQMEEEQITITKEIMVNLVLIINLTVWLILNLIHTNLKND